MYIRNQILRQWFKCGSKEDKKNYVKTTLTQITKKWYTGVQKNGTCAKKWHPLQKMTSPRIKKN